MWVSAPLYYLDKKYKREKVAGKSVYVEGGHRADAVPHQVTIYNGRLKETSVGEHERLNKHGFVLHSIKDGIFERIKVDMPKIEPTKVYVYVLCTHRTSGVGYELRLCSCF